MAINYKLIGRRVKETRKRKNLSQAMLAEFTDLSVAYIGHIETGRKQASLESLVKIANVLNTTVSKTFNAPVKDSTNNGVFVSPFPRNTAIRKLVTARNGAPANIHLAYRTESSKICPLFPIMRNMNLHTAIPRIPQKKPTITPIISDVCTVFCVP